MKGRLGVLRWEGERVGCVSTNVCETQTACWRHISLMLLQVE